MARRLRLGVQARRLHPGFIAAALFACAFAGGCDRQPAEPALPVVQALSFSGLDADAQAQLDEAQAAVAAAPASARANARLARLLHAYGQPQPAAAFYQRARTLAEADFELTYLHGRVLADTGAREEALAALQRASELNPSYLPALLALAELHADSGDAATSRGYYEAALRMTPDLPQALLGLGQLSRDEDPQAALALMRRATRGSAPYGAAHYAIAQVLRDAGDTEGARKELAVFERTRGQAPHVADPVLAGVQGLNLSRQGHLQRALNAYAAGKLELSALEFEKALEKDPGNAQARQNLIAVYGQLGRYDDAEAQYEIALAANPDLVQLHTNYALLQIKQENFAKAIAAYETAIAVDPGYGKSYLGIGAIHAAQGDADSALRWYRDALEHEPANRQARQYLGDALIRRGAFAEAIATLQPAVVPDDLPSAVYLRLLAQGQASLGRLAEAEGSLVRAEALARRFKQADLARTLLKDLGKVRMARALAAES